MTRKMISWLACMAVFLFIPQSCIHDDIYSSSDPASIEYHSKSVFKEDEKYIKNVMKIYFEHQLEIKKENGIPLWDYAMTMGRFDESFLIVPIVNGKYVVSCLQILRKENDVRFVYDNDIMHIKFFEDYVRLKNRKPLSQTIPQAAEAGRLMMCSVSTISMWYPDNENDYNGSGHWETQYITTCSENPGDGGSGCTGYYDSHGNCMPSGYEPPIYPYTPGGVGGNNNNNNQDPCEKLKVQTTSITFKNNITSLEGKTGDGYESGYRIGTSADGSLQNQLLQNKPGTQQVDLKAFSNTITIMHSHYDGLYPIFSPGDIIFFNQWVVWAQNWNSVSTNNPKIPLNNLTFTLVTSNGNYSFNFDGTSTTTLPNYTQQDIDDLNDKYVRLLDEAKTIANVSGSVTFDMDKLEKQFLKFIDDKMNMTGLKLYKTTTNGNAQLNLVNGNRNEVPCSN